MSISNMATLIRSGRQVVCTSGNKIGVFQLGATDFQEIVINFKPKETKPEEGSKTEGSEEHAGPNRILASTVSPSGQYMAVADDNKYLSIYRHEDNWNLVSQRLVSRRCTRLIFTEDDSSVLVADKSGDVFMFSISDLEAQGELLLGHLSMLFDMVLAHSEKFIVTCDRDEKIRISLFPNAYNIHAYCLGHTEFVSKLLYIKEKDTIVSGGGDGSVRFWTVDGDLLYHIPWSETPGGGDEGQEKITPAIKCLCYSKEQKSLFVSNDCSPCLRVYAVSWSGTDVSVDLKQEVNLKGPPWEICIDQSGFIWVLQPVEEETVSVWNFVENKLVRIDSSTDEGTNISKVVEQINSHWEFFKESISVENIYSTLRRAKVDNMKEYLEKKQDRLSGKGQNKSSENSPAKKIKVN